MTVKKYCDVTGFDPTKFNYHRLARRKKQSIQPGLRRKQVKVVDARGVDTPCLLTRMVGLFRLHLFPRRQRKRKSTRLLYTARICRFDLLRSINNLAHQIAKWTKKEDALSSQACESRRRRVKTEFTCKKRMRFLRELQEPSET